MALLIKGGTFYHFIIIFYHLNIWFFPFFPSATYKKLKLSVILRGGYVYSVGYVYCFFPNVPGAMFIQGGTFIPESRVVKL